LDPSSAADSILVPPEAGAAAADSILVSPEAGTAVVDSIRGHASVVGDGDGGEDYASDSRTLGKVRMWQQSASIFQSVSILRCSKIDVRTVFQV